MSAADLAGELQALVNNVRAEPRGGVDKKALARAEQALAEWESGKSGEGVAHDPREDTARLDWVEANAVVKDYWGEGQRWAVESGLLLGPHDTLRQNIDTARKK